MPCNRFLIFLFWSLIFKGVKNSVALQAQINFLPTALEVGRRGGGMLILTRTLSARISYWRARSVHESVPYAHAQQVLKGPFQIWNFYAYAKHTRKELMRMLRVRISSGCVPWANASVPNHKVNFWKRGKLMSMLSMRVRNCCLWSGCSSVPARKLSVRI